MTNFIAAAVQLGPASDTMDETLARILALLDQAAARGGVGQRQRQQRSTLMRCRENLEDHATLPALCR